MLKSLRRRWLHEYHEGLALGEGRFAAALVATSAWAGGLVAALLLGILAALAIYVVATLWGSKASRPPGDVRLVPIAPSSLQNARADDAAIAKRRGMTSARLEDRIWRALNPVLL
jgi:hypothetical protein